MKFFNAVIVLSKDGESIDKKEFKDPIEAMFYILSAMNEEERGPNQRSQNIPKPGMINNR